MIAAGVDHLRTLQCPAELPDRDRTALTCGLVFELLAGKYPMTLTALALGRWLPPTESGDAEVFFDRVGRTVGVALWARQEPASGRAVMNPHAQQSMVEQPDTKLQPIAFASARGEERAIAQLVLERCAANGWSIAWTAPGSEAVRLHPAPARVRNFVKRELARSTSTPSPIRGDLAAARLHSFKRSIEMGHAVLALRSSRSSWRDAPVGALLRHLSQALHVRQIRLAFDDDGACCGWATWAWLSAEGARKLQASGLRALHPSQWDEGDQLCVLERVETPEARVDHTAQILATLSSRAGCPLSIHSVFDERTRRLGSL